MQGVYRISSIKFNGAGSKYGEEKTDEYSLKRIGRTVDITNSLLSVGACGYIPYIKDVDGTDIGWNAMITSYITKLNEQENKIIVETQNSIYEFEREEVDCNEM